MYTFVKVNSNDNYRKWGGRIYLVDLFSSHHLRENKDPRKQKFKVSMTEPMTT